MPALTDTFTLANGLAIPKIGFGTWQIPDGPEAYDSVAEALRVGYRHIDTARAYGNEAERRSRRPRLGVPRDEIFVTTKLPARSRTANGRAEAFETSTRQPRSGPIDLYLIHAPWPWHEMGTGPQGRQHRGLEGLRGAATQPAGSARSASPTSTSTTSSRWSRAPR